MTTKKTKIEWSQRTWNPILGCSMLSAGCAKCYAMKQVATYTDPVQKEIYKPYVSNSPWAGPRWTGAVALHPDQHVLTEPYRWKASTIFVNSLSDMFHEKLTFEEIGGLFGIMAGTPQHTYQVLTKRAARMRAFFAFLNAQASTDRGRREVLDTFARALIAKLPGNHVFLETTDAWPLPNVWLGTSVEDSKAIARIEHLRACPAAVRFLSCEPLLEELDASELNAQLQFQLEHVSESDVHWVIVGAESGTDARPMEEVWVAKIRDSCQRYHIPFFYKQRVDNGKKISLPLLQGRVWQEMPRASK